MVNEKNSEIRILVPSHRGVDDLPLFSPLKESEVDGIGMGVLTNGVPYLTQAGLARACGIEPKNIRNIESNWKEEQTKPRGRFIAEALESSGYRHEEALSFRVKIDNGNTFLAYPDLVCMAFLEYYAFEARNPDAIRNYRTLSRIGLRAYIYKQVGYSPESNLLLSWKFFHDRVSLVSNQVPDGYFCVFNEIAGMIVDLISNGMIVNDTVIPDISVGKSWSSFWKTEELSEKFGFPIQYKHNYPDYYRQAASNPQTPKAYPNGALGIFRRWFNEIYLKEKFPRYILTKMAALPNGRDDVEKLIQIFNSPDLIQEDSSH